MLKLIFFLLISALHVGAAEFPVSYQGRYRSSEGYARAWLFQRYHAQRLKKNDLAAFQTDSNSALAFLWSLEFRGASPYQDVPLFWIGSASEKKTLGLPLKRERFSYEEVKTRLKENPLVNAFLSIGSLQLEKHYENRLLQLQKKGLSPKKIAFTLEKEWPLKERLDKAGNLFRTLPSQWNPKEWLSLKALEVKEYDPLDKKLKLAKNFTFYSDKQFENIRRAYDNAKQAFFSGEKTESAIHALSKELSLAYAPFAGRIVERAHEKSFATPTLLQLKVETGYVSIPWIPFLIGCYSITAIAFVFLKKKSKLAMGLFLFSFCIHTALLVARCYILNRPPVASMFETVLYVPWMAACAVLIFKSLREHLFSILSVCLISVALLTLLEISDLNEHLDVVQAVLDSQFWLFIHVLLVVGSYGILILGALLAHFYLALDFIHQKETPMMTQLSNRMLQTLYGGTAMLILGTLLGGVWAAESWGRFWDWDPKESWAFISICTYLIWIHAYRFQHIASFGLAIGAITGLIVISFTWYGVNYILGTGLHSYGFGNGGEKPYFGFISLEILFIAFALWHPIKINNRPLA